MKWKVFPVLGGRTAAVESFRLSGGAENHELGWCGWASNNGKFSAFQP